MPEEFKPGCQRPPLKKPAAVVSDAAAADPVKEVKSMLPIVGKEAPAFAASGYYQGKFMNFSLDEYRGKWVLLCFYPGDFTFV
ncbi:MAG: redoxin domain-containing protein [Firmicutes bacterium]|jgi:peroxiredoxin (alkyl hydroperoxide reductase subunit C)|nr:redoxin domain-containing protein [Bacillota bacterium]